MHDIFAFIWPGILQKAEFWSAIAGAIVGGLIAYFIQIRALREGRNQRADDRKLVQQAQAHALLFKMIRIHSDFHPTQFHLRSTNVVPIAVDVGRRTCKPHIVSPNTTRS
jgi:hypothetical protein